MNQNVQHIHSWFIAHSQTLAVAESITCGNVLARLGAVSGASRFLAGGVVAYTIDMKAKLLGVNRAEAEMVNAVSQNIAIQMAYGVCQLTGAHVGVATTGYAEPWGGDGNKPQDPLAYFAIVRGGVEVPLVTGLFTGAGLSRTAMQGALTDHVLAQLAAYISNQA